MRTTLKLLSAAAIACFAIVGTAHAEFDAAQKQEIENLVKSYLLEHPEILREMSANLEAKERAAEEQVRGKTLIENAATIFKSTSDPVAGNAKGDVTIVEFMDYNCSWCKKAVTEVSSILESDKNVRVVFKEFPIFGAGSEFAARAAMAAAKQGKYWELHQALFKHDGPVTEEVTRQLATDIGLDVARLEIDMKDEGISKSMQETQALAIALQINGTPAFVVDDKVFPGYVPKDQLLSAIAQVRSAGGCKLC
jgi:protein-disulfide isomerase